MASPAHFAKRRHAALTEIRERLEAHGESPFREDGRVPSSNKQEDEFNTVVVESLAAVLRLIDEK